MKTVHLLGIYQAGSLQVDGVFFLEKTSVNLFLLEKTTVVREDHIQLTCVKLFCHTH